jgi:DNA transposition AAA+ family ATPase
VIPEVLETPRLDLGSDRITGDGRFLLPLNLEKWSHLTDAVQQELTWFHQHAIDSKLTWNEMAEALDYDRSNINKVMHGVYAGSWDNVCSRIASYRRILDTRGQIQKQEFAENSITKKVFSGLKYALANNSITIITGESRMGKTEAARAWRERNNHGRSVLVTCPVYGGPKALIRRIADAIGVGTHYHRSTFDLLEGIYKAFNKNRILILDEARRLLPNTAGGSITALELVRDIKDETGCGLALLSTERFNTDLKRLKYQFEQVLGRIGMPIRLPKEITQADILPIVQQYIPKPGKQLIETMHQIANDLGRLGIMVEVLKVASRAANAEKKALTENHIFGALKFRKQMMGELSEQ